MSSILTNVGAMAALQSLSMTNRSLTETQNRISSGMRVANAKDNSAMWSIATTMRGDINGFKAVSDNLALADSTISVARQAAESVSSLLNEMKTKITAAQDGNVDRTKLQTDLSDLISQIQSVVDAAQFNGQNYINASASVSILASLNRGASGVTVANISFTAVDLNSTSGGGLDLSTVDVTTASGAASALTTIEGAITTVETAATTFGSVQHRIDIQKDFIAALSDALTSGVGSIVDANMEQEAARLNALQVQQQLGMQALSIANGAPQSVLALFR